MAKLMILIALLILAASMAEASIYRTTTVTTYETMDENDQMSRKCQQEMMQTRMDSCREFMRSGRMAMLRTILRDEEQEHQQPPQECCSNLSNLSRDCRCPILQKVMQEMQQSSPGEQGQQQQEMVARAERLPEMCGLRPQRCQMRQQPSFF
ncbi:Bifunctional inhibitor/lipid-transfer protein/seed storage 2S albumin protein [Dioscorea alata]|uniref:Bifunctional inhibitor/lipid-transfer protein/seed storage 2S albumin protein n=1 Tax=Dioscorea alata TaxID=55571 RepID=A0ACB7VN66_DIOAL|nr:Bifunctional inhibitor/lipid-transfer protein/seed storage 2S albumin protein [Dioscorea alata]